MMECRLPAGGWPECQAANVRAGYTQAGRGAPMQLLRSVAGCPIDTGGGQNVAADYIAAAIADPFGDDIASGYTSALK